MTLKKIDLWLRGIWMFWDTHGTRLTGVVQILHSGISAVAAAITNMDGKTAALLLGISGFLGAITRARGQNNADIKSGVTVDPAPPTPNPEP
jgi:hypothetical protein